MNFELGRSREAVEAENRERIMQERIDSAMVVPEEHSDQSAEWQANRMIEILNGKIHAVSESGPEPRPKTNLGEAWDGE